MPPNAAKEVFREEGKKDERRSEVNTVEKDGP